MKKSSKNKKTSGNEEKVDESIEEIITKKTASRSFKCPDCGWEVILNGTVASDKSITKCSKCSRE